MVQDVAGLVLATVVKVPLRYGWRRITTPTGKPLINTPMIQDTLALPEWAGVLTDADRRGLTPVFHTNMTPYSEIQLRTDRRLDLTGIPPAAT